MSKSLACILLLWSLTARAEVEIQDAWAAATRPGQDVGAAYMTLKSTVDATLLGASSPVADSVEIHRMWMDHGVMKMRMMKTLALPAGKSVKLEPGGLHLMLFDLKKPLTAGETLELTLTLKDKGGKPRSQRVELPIRAE
jgi:hypothetical protein